MQSNTYADDIDGHLPVLDGVRGWAIIMVLVVHTCWVFPTLYMHDLAPAERIFHSIAEYGRLGVDLFFVLSGFLITGLLLKSRSRDNYYSSFYARRALRIFPLYYLFITVVFFITPLFVKTFNDNLQPHMYTVYYLYLQNFLSEPGDTLPLALLGAMWSLAVEEHFYLVWPAIIKRFNRPALVKIIAALTLLALALRCYIILFGHILKYWAFSWTICRMDTLLVGALLAIALRSEVRRVLEAWKWKMVTLLGLFSILIMFVNLYLRKWVATNSFGYTFHALFFAAVINLVLFLPKSNLLVRLFDNSIVRLFGKHSYCVYLVHAPIMYFLWKYYMAYNVSTYFPTVIVFFSLVTALSLLASLIVWHLVEKHFLKLKDYFGTRREPVGEKCPAVESVTGEIRA